MATFIGEGETMTEKRYFGIVTAFLEPDRKAARLELRRQGGNADRLNDSGVESLKEWARRTLEREGYQLIEEG